MSREFEQNGGHSQPESVQKLPDPGICRAERYYTTGLILCLVFKPQFCKHALDFGNAIFCCHPERREIIARTQSTYDFSVNESHEQAAQKSDV